jgi:hypothetical protein
MNMSKKNKFSNSRFVEEYIQKSQILEELQVNQKIDINIISDLEKQYKKLFYLVKRNNFLYCKSSIIKFYSYHEFIKK